MRELALFALLAALYMLSASPDYYPGDDRYYLNLTGQMVERGTVALRGSADRVDPDAAFRGADGRVYTKYTPGHPAALAVVFACVRLLEPRLAADTYAFIQRLAFSLVPACLVALAIVLGAMQARRLGYRESTCLVWALGLGLATNLWPATKTLLSEPTQAFLVTAIGVLAMRALSGDEVWVALALGAACGWAFTTKITLALAFPVAALALLARPGKRVARLAAFALPLAIGVALIGAYNHARTGRVWVLGYEHGQDTVLGFPTPWWAGLHGLLISSGKGLFLYSPFLILALLGARAFVTRHRGPGLVVLGIVVPHVLLYATWNCWHGDWSWGPRYLVPIHVLAGMLALPAVERLRGRPALALACALGLSVQVLGVLLEPFSYIEIVKSVPVGAGADKLVDTAPEKPFVIDGTLHNHYFPSFSPLAGHLWLLRRIASGPAPDDHPWGWMRSAVLTPQVPGVRLDLWWARPTNLDVEPIARAALALCVLALGAALFALVRRWPVDEVTPGPEPPGAPGRWSLPAPPRALVGALFALWLAGACGAALTGSGESRFARIGCALALAGTALAAGAATKRLVANDDSDADAAGRTVATLVLTATMLTQRAVEPSSAVLSALAAALILERALAFPDRTRAGLALLALTAVAAASAWARGAGAMPAWQGAYALTLSPGRSLLPYAPFLVLALPRLARGDLAAALLAGAALIPLAVEAGTGAWMNDTGWGPAGMAPALIALAIAAGASLARLRPHAIVLAAMSIAITAASLAAPPAEYLALQARVPNLAPPGHRVFQGESRFPAAGAVFVPDLSPVPGQLWMTLRRTSPPPWTGQFWRGYELR